MFDSLRAHNEFAVKDLVNGLKSDVQAAMGRKWAAGFGETIGQR